MAEQQMASQRPIVRVSNVTIDNTGKDTSHVIVMLLTGAGRFTMTPNSVTASLNNHQSGTMINQLLLKAVPKGKQKYFKLCMEFLVVKN